MYPGGPFPTRFRPAPAAYQDPLPSNSFLAGERLPGGCACGVPGFAVDASCVPCSFTSCTAYIVICCGSVWCGMRSSITVLAKYFSARLRRFEVRCDELVKDPGSEISE